MIDVLGRVGRTFHVSSLAQVGAIAALDDAEHVAAARAATRAARSSGCARGPRARRVGCIPSLANFVLIDCGRPSTPIYDQLLGAA